MPPSRPPAREVRHLPKWAGAILQPACRRWIFGITLVCGWTLFLHGQLGRREFLQAELHRLEGEWAIMTSYMQEAHRLKPHFEVMLNQPKRVLEVRSTKGWASALRSVIDGLEPRIELEDVHAMQEGETPEAFTLHLAGTSEGETARKTADDFRQHLQTSLAREFSGSVMAEFKALEDDLTGPSQGSLERAHFKIAVNVVQVDGSNVKN